MRKAFIFLLTAVFLIGIAGAAAGATARVTVNDKEISFDSPPVMIQGRVMVSIRPVMEAAGADVYWNDYTQTVTVTKNGSVVRMKVGGSSSLDGKELKPEVPLTIIKGRLMAPLRFIGEALQMKVDWNSQSYVASIVSNEIAAAAEPVAQPATVTKTTSNPMEQPEIPGMIFMTGSVQTLSKTPPTDIRSDLTQRFGQRTGFGDYTINVESGTAQYCMINIVMKEAIGNPSGWHTATQSQKEALLNEIVKQLHAWYEDARIEVTVSIEGERATDQPSFGETILRPNGEKGYIVSVSQSVARGYWNTSFDAPSCTVN
ncbi:MAG: stalk domain-containing protein [Solirubrobacterales bacterium]